MGRCYFYKEIKFGWLIAIVCACVDRIYLRSTLKENEKNGKNNFFSILPELENSQNIEMYGAFMYQHVIQWLEKEQKKWKKEHAERMKSCLRW